jgi:hypothetical protein
MNRLLFLIVLAMSALGYYASVPMNSTRCPASNPSFVRTDLGTLFDLCW